MKNLLIIDDQENMRHMLTALTAKAGYQVTTAANGVEALALLKNQEFDFILCDVKMPEMDGMEFLQAAKKYMGDATVIMMSAYGTIDLALEGMKNGAYDFISKPFKTDEVLLALKKAEEREELRRENSLLKKQLRSLEGDNSFANMIGKSRQMQEVFSLAIKVARHTTTVLITGESGTGKELIARGIHLASPRADKPMVPVNCAGIPEMLLESELFGHAKGAFTGANRTHKGLFEEADGGTLFLDEIGELPLALQVKLLRVLQENEIRPVGASIVRTIDVRVIAATSRNLENEIAAGSFRSDLFYRLNVMPLHIPPLREHPEDIPHLCSSFISRFNTKLGLAIEAISPAAMQFLVNYEWPGNVRELENGIERAMIMTEGPVLQQENFCLEYARTGGYREKSFGYGGLSLKKAKQEWEMHLITRALAETGGNRSQAAELLELSFPSILKKIKEYQIVVK